MGDALGAAVEFLTLADIHKRFGPEGIQDYAPVYGRKGALTDDTQMTLWTAEGLIRGHNRGRAKGIVHVPSIVWHAYQRWLWCQEGVISSPAAGVAASRACAGEWPLDGWLITHPELRQRRGPGNTNLAAAQRPPRDARAPAQ